MGDTAAWLQTYHDKKCVFGSQDRYSCIEIFREYAILNTNLVRCKNQMTVTSNLTSKQLLPLGDARRIHSSTVKQKRNKNYSCLMETHHKDKVHNIIIIVL